jgi:maleate isomerase
VNFGWLPNVRSIFDETEERVYGLGRRIDVPEAEALFISGVGLPTISVIGALEMDLGKPVVSSASATMWNALRVAGLKCPTMGYGRLLEIIT